MSDAPYSFGQARDAAAAASRAQIGAEDFMREAAKGFAVAEEAYRVALAQLIVELRSQGHAATLCKDLARGDTNVARLKTNSLIAEGVREAAVHAAWRRAADRRDTSRFIDWSARRDLADGYGTTPEPDEMEPIGSRRAA